MINDDNNISSNDDSGTTNNNNNTSKHNHNKNHDNHTTHNKNNKSHCNSNDKSNSNCHNNSNSNDDNNGFNCSNNNNNNSNTVKTSITNERKSASCELGHLSPYLMLTFPMQKHKEAIIGQGGSLPNLLHASVHPIRSNCLATVAAIILGVTNVDSNSLSPTSRNTLRSQHCHLLGWRLRLALRDLKRLQSIMFAQWDIEESCKVVH